MKRLRRNDDLNQAAKVLYQMQTGAMPFPHDEDGNSNMESTFVQKFTKNHKNRSYATFCQKTMVAEYSGWVKLDKIQYAKLFIEDCLGVNPIHNVWKYDLNFPETGKPDPLIAEFNDVFPKSGNSIRRRLQRDSPVMLRLL